MLSYLAFHLGPSSCFARGEMGLYQLSQALFSGRCSRMDLELYYCIALIFVTGIPSFLFTLFHHLVTIKYRLLQDRSEILLWERRTAMLSSLSMAFNGSTEQILLSSFTATDENKHWCHGQDSYLKKAERRHLPYLKVASRSKLKVGKDNEYMAASLHLKRHVI